MVKSCQVKFLHIADVHLGCTRYQLAESPRDFFDAWVDVLHRYAIDERVDFVMMCGDFFHKRSVPPETMNYAVAGLNLLKEGGIPVVAIEGNHDQKHTDTEYSWLRSLANWNLIHLLEPEYEEGQVRLAPWDSNLGRGGFLDIGRARIFGSHWYGASGNTAIPLLTDAIRENRREGAFHILMLHTDVEGHQTHPIPALSMESLQKLRSVTDYVGLGHTHMHYEIDNWAFNPGSIEVTNIAEFRETRGVFLVEVGDDNSFELQHITDYRHRPFQRLRFDVSGCASPAEVTEGAIERCRSEARPAEKDKPAPIVELTLHGQLGFPNSLLETQKMREEIQRMTSALHVRLRNHSVPIEYAVAEDVEPDAGRDHLERGVIEDLVQRDKRFRSRTEDLARTIVAVKQQVLAGDDAEQIADTITEMLFGERGDTTEMAAKN
jgi:DNA repair exonuclease SbcCD nuclease subunit